MSDDNASFGLNNSMDFRGTITFNDGQDGPADQGGPTNKFPSNTTANIQPPSQQQQQGNTNVQVPPLGGQFGAPQQQQQGNMNMQAPPSGNQFGAPQQQQQQQQQQGNMNVQVPPSGNQFGAPQQQQQGNMNMQVPPSGNQFGASQQQQQQGNMNVQAPPSSNQFGASQQQQQQGNMNMQVPPSGNQFGAPQQQQQQQQQQGNMNVQVPPSGNQFGAPQQQQQQQQQQQGNMNVQVPPPGGQFGAPQQGNMNMQLQQQANRSQGCGNPTMNMNAPMVQNGGMMGNQMMNNQMMGNQMMNNQMMGNQMMNNQMFGMGNQMMGNQMMKNQMFGMRNQMMGNQMMNNQMFGNQMMGNPMMNMNNAPQPTIVTINEAEACNLGWYSGSIKASKWVEYLTGCTESQFAYKYEEVFKDKKKDSANVMETPRGRFNTGSFSLLAVEDLEKEFISKPVAQGQPAARCPIRIYVPNKDTHMPLYFYELGVSTLQADPANEGCTFQVASNFSCVESIGETSTPDTPDFLTDYCNDFTQGPAASISAGPASIERVLRPFDAEYGNQTGTKQINLLESLKEYFTTSNGYVTNTGQEKDINFDNIEAAARKVRVGCLTGADVTFGGRFKGRFTSSGGMEDDKLNILKTPHKINQVFTAAMNLRQGEHGKRNITLKNAELKAKALLRGAYMGTYLNALRTKSPRLFLTLIGGGAFGNSVDWILEAILYSHRVFAMDPRNDSLKSVELVLFNIPPCLQMFMGGLTNAGIPYTYTEILLRQN